MALTAAVAPAVIEPLLPRLGEIIRSDSSTIVRDYTVDAIGNYASTGSPAVEHAYPLLKEALDLWEGKHAGQALRGMSNVASMAPGLGEELHTLAQHYINDSRGVVRKAAKALVKRTELHTGGKEG